VVPVLVLALLVATTTAFALTEALKLQRTPVGHPRFDPVFSPACACRHETARLRFRLRNADTIDAVIVDSKGHDVRTIASASRRPAGQTVLRWDGRDDDGAVVPDGAYRLRLRFAKAERTIVMPGVVEVDTHPPSVELLSFAPREVAKEGEGARIVLRVSERARPLLLVDGKLVLRGALSDPGKVTVVWNGSSLRAGRYLVTLEARDRAGNVSAPTEGIIVSVRAGQ
jgi:hypothetical protein